MGGLVTSYGAGMSVPDWPNSYGYNMFTFPPRLWVQGIFYEHTHRLAGTLVGMLSIALAAVAWRTESRPGVRYLAYGVLGAVIVQGVLGGLRVVWDQLDLAVIHGCIAHAFFCMTALMTAMTSRWWSLAAAPVDMAAMRKTSRLAAIAAAIIYVQLIVGALMRHYKAGLAIPDLPLAYGQWLPPMSHSAVDQLNQLRAWKWDLESVTLAQICLHFLHRLGAVLVTTAISILVAQALRRQRGNPLLTRLAGLLILLLAAQLTLGVLVVLWRKPADITSYHVAVGALTLLVTFSMMVRAMRLCASRYGSHQCGSPCSHRSRCNY